MFSRQLVRGLQCSGTPLLQLKLAEFQQIVTALLSHAADSTGAHRQAVAMGFVPGKFKRRAQLGLAGDLAFHTRRFFLSKAELSQFDMQPDTTLVFFANFLLKLFNSAGFPERIRGQVQLRECPGTGYSARTTSLNLAWACLPWNSYKGPNVAGYDPDRLTLQPLFHPREDVWSEHFAGDGSLLVGLTAIGRTTIEVLRINLSDRAEHRRLLMEGGLFLNG